METIRDHHLEPVRRCAWELTGALRIGEGTHISPGVHVIVPEWGKIVADIGARVALGNNVVLIAASAPNKSHLFHLEGFAERYPELVNLESIGKSYEGRDIWLLTVTNFRVGDADRKPAMYIDGNIHSNEIQGQEIALYTAWYLCEMADRVPWVSDLLDDRTMYIVPTINPDGRAAFIDSPNTPSSPRSGVAPRDDDGDGLFDEDDLDDLNGDGHITLMRRRDPNGRWLVSREDPRLMIRAASV